MEVKEVVGGEERRGFARERRGLGMRGLVGIVGREERGPQEDRADLKVDQYGQTERGGLALGWRGVLVGILRLRKAPFAKCARASGPPFGFGQGRRDEGASFGWGGREGYREVGGYG